MTTDNCLSVRLSVLCLTDNLNLVAIMVKLSDRVAWAIGIIKDDKKVGNGIRNIDLASLLGINEKTLNTYKQGQGELKGSAVEGLVEHFNFNPMWLLKGQGEPFPGARQNYEDVCGPEDQPATAPDEFVFIRQVNGKISAGGGLSPDDTSDVRAAFRRDWIKRKGGKPENMSLIKVSGDSMEPTLLPGDMVLIDHARNVVASEGGIYAISMDHEIMIKRLQILHHEGKLRIISDNKQYPPQEIDADKVAINGKVLWFAREMER